MFFSLRPYIAYIDYAEYFFNGIYIFASFSNVFYKKKKRKMWLNI